MKNILFLAAIILFGFAAKAQTQPATPATGTQIVEVNMPNIISISAPASNAQVSFSTINDYLGKESIAQPFSVTSNKNWQLEMKSDANFQDLANSLTMPITGGIFKMKVIGNPDITVATGFDNYSQVTTSNQIVVTTGAKGNATPVSVQYRVAPGFTYPGGNYTNTVTYTATQL